MSATNRGSERNPRDEYPTPPELCTAIVRKLIDDGLTSLHAPFQCSDQYVVLEPSCGDGNFIRSILAEFSGWSVDGVDIVPRDSLENLQGVRFYQSDFLAWQSRYRLIIGNPPFSDAEQHVRHAISLLEPQGTLAMVLSLNFFGSFGRYPFWREHPLHKVCVLVPRPSFSGGGNDSSEYGLFVWRRAVPPPGGRTQLEHLKWREPKKRKQAR
jgi:hypothetical protein